MKSKNNHRIAWRFGFFVIRQQALKGKWIFKLKAIYTIGILDFVFDEDKDDEEYYHHVVKLMDVEKKEVLRAREDKHATLPTPEKVMSDE